MNPAERTAEALTLIQALRAAATQGDASAAAGLAKIGNAAAGHLHALARHPEGYPGKAAADAAAADAENWPVSIPAIRELRDSSLPPSLGRNLAIRLDGKRARNFDYRTRTGFAFSVFRDMDKRGLPPLEAGNLSALVDAAMAHLEDDCQGDFAGFPWPDELAADADVRNSADGQGQDRENAFRSTCRAWLKYGLAKLAKERAE